MKRLKILCLILLVLVPFGVSAHAQEQSAGTAPRMGQQPSTEEFVPLNELPPEEQLPAAPLLIAAYVVVWFGLFAYVWTVWRRLRKIEDELGQLEARLSARQGKR
jgi:CcmD family protein